MSFLLRVQIFSTVLFQLSSCYSDMFTSTLDMQESTGTESIAFEDSQFFVLLQKRRLDRTVDLHERLRSVVSRRAADDVLGAFLFVSRFAAYNLYSPIRKLQPALNDLRAAFSSPSSRKWWPAGSDVNGAAAGICKLQQVYDIPATRMVAMKSRLLPTASPEDCKEVARGCLRVGPFGSTSVWSRKALKLAALQHINNFRKFQLGLHWLEDNDDRRRLLFGWSTGSQPPIRYPAPPESDVGEYKSVCVQQGDLRPPAGQLLCTMSTNYGDPRLILRPHKIEVLSLKPRIVIFPDFLTPSEVDYIRAAARKGFKRAGIYSPTNTSGAPSWKRIGKVSWLWDVKHPLLQRLTRRIATATHLSLESAEAYQVANYGLGGHYTPHLDAHGFDKVADFTDISAGARLATMLVYLSDVAAGGATAFVKLGIGVKPRMGDALFWYDLEPYVGSEAPRHFSFWHQKRNVDELTVHAGCPVLWGSKWIATKWIRQRYNVVVRYNTPA